MPSRPPSARERIAAKRAARTRRLPVVPVLAVVGVLALVLAGGLVWRYQQTVGAMQQADPRQESQPVASGGTQQGGSAPASLSKPFNVLLIGVDKRASAEEGVRSDTLIAVRVDPQQNRASMLSIPRDSVVSIPQFGQAKINTAFTNGYNNAEELYGKGTTPDAGGGALVAETVEQWFGVKIDYVAQVDFNGFAGLVDAIGGVVMDVERPLLDAEFPTDDFGVERVYIPAGLQVMDGRTALIYARSRHASDDFGRGKRQQQVLRALLQQVKSRGMLENVGTVNQWVDVLAKNVRTTLPINNPAEIAGLANLARELGSDGITQLSINPDDVQVTMNGSDLYWNQPDLEVLLARWQSAAPQPAATAAVPASTTVQVVNAAGIEGLATEITASLRGEGFTLAEPITAPATRPTTRILDYTGDSTTARRIAETLGLDASTVTIASEPATSPEVGIVIMVGQDWEKQ